MCLYLCKSDDPLILNINYEHWFDFPLQLEMTHPLKKQQEMNESLFNTFYTLLHFEAFRQYDLYRLIEFCREGVD